MTRLLVEDDKIELYIGNQYRKTCNTNRTIIPLQSTGLLPLGVKYIHSLSTEFHIAQIEVPPAIRNISYINTNKHNALETERETHFVPFPWLQIFVSINKQYGKVRIHILASNGPIESMDDQLFFWPIPNVNNSLNNELCIYGEALGLSADVVKEQNSGYILRTLLSNIWQSGFNNNIYTWHLSIPDTFLKETDDPFNTNFINLLSEQPLEKIINCKKMDINGIIDRGRNILSEYEKRNIDWDDPYYEIEYIIADIEAEADLDPKPLTSTTIKSWLSKYYTSNKFVDLVTHLSQ